MLCACSGEQFKFEEAPQSPESLAVGDFSICGLSSRTGDWESKFDDSQVDDVESTLKETASLNYEVNLSQNLNFSKQTTSCSLVDFSISGRKPELSWVVSSFSVAT